MIKLNDIDYTVINPAHIIYFNIDDNVLTKEYDHFYRHFTGKLQPKLAKNCQGLKVTILGEIKCMFNYYGDKTFKYDSVNNFNEDYKKLLKATNVSN